MRRLPLLLVLAGCGDPAGPLPEAPAILAINGAAAPLLVAAQPLVIEGRGLGTAPGVVLLPTATGVAAHEPLAWQPTFAEVPAPPDLTAGNVAVVTADGDTLGGITARLAPVDTTSPDARPWRAAAPVPFPWSEGAAAGLTFATSSGFSSIVVLAGGRRGDGSLQDSTYLGLVDGDGAITQWVHAADTIVPPPRRLHALIGVTPLNSRVALDGSGVAWMIGGLDAAGTVLADVRGIAISSTGSYGFWTPLASLPAPRAGLAVASGLGTLYAVGGFGRDSLARPEVYVASISAGGTITGWFRGPDLPQGVAFAGAALVHDHLYVVGGQTGRIDPDAPPDSASLSNGAYRIRLSRRTGFFVDSAWTALPPLATGRARHGMTAAAGGLVVSGGVVAEATAEETIWAVLLTDGTLGPFRPRVAAPRPARVSGAASPAVHDAAGRAVVTQVGGMAGGPIPDVWWH